MLQRMLTSALIAGAAAALLAVVLQFSFVQKYLLLSEQYEAGVMTHFAGVPQGGGMNHGDSTAAGSGDETAAAATDEAAPAAAEEERSAFTRNGLTVLFLGVVYIGYGMLLVAGFAISERFGYKVTARQGLLWGLAGFATFQLIPALGLTPVLPGTPSTPITARQIWWFATVLCTGGALALIAYGKGVAAYVIAVVIAALPHLIGAPELGSYAGVAPPEVGGAFAARTLAVGMIVWATLGWLSGRLWGGAAA
ncbi:MAG: cobalt transporter [Cereibacter sphaeroides]|uniref:Cobalt transporter n=1 Tax=Cereibacter sphaeroides TaxID=1063 RepID=A0A2W5S8N1_CERSP|nr:MAG: cobalt transporter [Cereibacter sphaeroides]